jgi:hypothetical protein
VADITYVAITAGFVYIAVILDAWSRKVTEGHNTRRACPGVLEADAYDLQALYLRLSGLRDEGLLMQVLGMLKSSCGYSDP